MLHKTRAIVLRATPYGDTSLIVSAYTEQFGLQSYIVKGARRVSKKGGGQAQFFQPSALLDLVVYHNDLKHLQIIKEIKWALIYQKVLSNVMQNTVALFMVELLGKCINQTESNPELFEFVADSLQILDEAEPAVVANMPLYFSLHLATQLGFRPEDNFDAGHPVLDLQAGRFVSEAPSHGAYLEDRLAAATYAILLMNSPVTLYRTKLNRLERQQLLHGYQQFYQYHVADFGHLRSVKVLEEILS